MIRKEHRFSRSVKDVVLREQAQIPISTKRGKISDAGTTLCAWFPIYGMNALDHVVGRKHDPRFSQVGTPTLSEEKMGWSYVDPRNAVGLSDWANWADGEIGKLLISLKDLQAYIPWKRSKVYQDGIPGKPNRHESSPQIEETILEYDRMTDKLKDAKAILEAAHEDKVGYKISLDRVITLNRARRELCVLKSIELGLPIPRLEDIVLDFNEFRKQFHS